MPAWYSQSPNNFREHVLEKIANDVELGNFIKSK